MFIWRCTLLAGFGLLVHPFYRIEILFIYGVLGINLVCLSTLSTRLILLIAICLLIGLPRIALSKFHNANLEPDIASANEIAMPIIAEPVKAAPKNEKVSDIGETTMEREPWFDHITHAYSIDLPNKLNYQFGLMGRGYTTLALFLFGLLCGRMLNTNVHHVFRKNLLLIGIVSWSIAFLLHKTLHAITDYNIYMVFDIAGNAIQPGLLLKLALNELSAVASTSALIMTFLFLYRSSNFQRVGSLLEPYGRTALTNYVMQGLIGLVLFAPSLLGCTFGLWGNTSLMLFGVVIYVAQGIASILWLKKYRYGPLEWLWRMGTYRKSLLNRKIQKE